MDLIILLAVGVCLKIGQKFWRLCIAACIGAVFYILKLFIIWFTWFQFLVGAVMVIVSFGFYGIKRTLKQICLFYFISFLFGGISFSLMCILNSGNFTILNGAIIGKFNIPWIIVAGLIGFILIGVVLRRRAKHVLVDVVISVGGREVNTRILLDTGNLLKEPYENRPVMIVQKDVAKRIFDDVMIDRLGDILEGTKDIPIGMFFIPYRSLGKKYGYLLGFKPDFVTVKGNSKRYSNLVIGICDDVICETGAYSGIFGLDTFDEGGCYEYC